MPRVIYKDIPRVKNTDLPTNIQTHIPGVMNTDIQTHIPGIMNTDIHIHMTGVMNT